MRTWRGRRREAGRGDGPAKQKGGAAVRRRMDALGWVAVALGAVAIVALVLLLRRLSRVEPDFSPPHAPPPAPAGSESATQEP